MTEKRCGIAEALTGAYGSLPGIRICFIALRLAYGETGLSSAFGFFDDSGGEAEVEVRSCLPMLLCQAAQRQDRARYENKRLTKP